MKAIYRTLDGQPGDIEYAVIIGQNMNHSDGFTLLGFHSWEDVNDQKICAAVTNIAQFDLHKDKIGFHNGKDED